MPTRFIMIGQWGKDGLALRPMRVGHILAAGETHSTHNLQFVLPLPSGSEEVVVILYLMKTKLMPRSQGAALGLAPRSLDFMRASVGHFLEDYWVLTPKMRSGLDLLWSRTGIFDSFPYHADRHFRDVKARAVYEAMHALNLHFDPIKQEWLE